MQAIILANFAFFVSHRERPYAVPTMAKAADSCVRAVSMDALN
jgi:hypothetical protein